MVDERLNLIQEEIETYEHLHRGGQVAANGNIPPSIDKDVALVLQGHYYPERMRDAPKHMLKTMFCFKHLNGQKLSSHMWFFEGFCKHMNPKYCVLIDAGTRPDSMGLVNYFNAMEKDPDIGGCGGFMGVEEVLVPEPEPFSLHPLG